MRSRVSSIFFLLSPPLSLSLSLTLASFFSQASSAEEDQFFDAEEEVLALPEKASLAVEHAGESIVDVTMEQAVAPVSPVAPAPTIPTAPVKVGWSSGVVIH